VEEYGHAAPDPLHPGVIFGGKVTRCDEKTGEVQNVGPVPLRSTWTKIVHGLAQQFALATRLAVMMHKDYEVLKAVSELEQALAALLARAARLKG